MSGRLALSTRSATKYALSKAMFSRSENAASSMLWQYRHQNADKKSMTGRSCSRAFRNASSSDSIQWIKGDEFGLGEKRSITQPVLSAIFHITLSASGEYAPMANVLLIDI